jgi:hypothetical protein
VSRILIGEDLAIDNDGLHASIEKSFELPFAKRYHHIQVDYFRGREAVAWN